MLKFIFYAALAAAAALAVVYFLPGEIKVNALEKFAGFVPESIKDKAEGILLTPPEKRAKIIDKLEDKLENLKGLQDDPETEKFIEESEALINELKSKNDSASVTEIVTNKLAEKLIGSIKQETVSCEKQ